MLICIEGVDCSGKETQSKLLAQALIKEGKSVARFSFPFYETATGKIIANQYLGKHEQSLFNEGAVNVDPTVASLYYAADRKYNLPIIQKALKEHDVVILDRYVYSNMAHQGCKLSRVEREKFFNFIESLEFKLLSLPVPDLTIFLYLPLELTSKLKREREELPDGHEQDETYLARAEETYLSLAQKFDFKQINCSQSGNILSKEDIAEKVLALVKTKLK